MHTRAQKQTHAHQCMVGHMMTGVPNLTPDIVPSFSSFRSIFLTFGLYSQNSMWLPSPSPTPPPPHIHTSLLRHSKNTLPSFPLTHSFFYPSHFLHPSNHPSHSPSLPQRVLRPSGLSKRYDTPQQSTRTRRLTHAHAHRRVMQREK